MTISIQSAGYIVVDNEAIHGRGLTAQTAWEDFLETMGYANIAVLSDDADTYAELGSWVKASDFRILSASADLLEQVEAKGGAEGWWNVGGVACTREQSEGE